MSNPFPFHSPRDIFQLSSTYFSPQTTKSTHRQQHTTDDSPPLLAEDNINKLKLVLADIAITMVGLATIAAFSGAFAGVLAAPSASLAPRNQDSFEASCKHWKVQQQDSNAWLQGYCRDDAGLLWHSVINLNQNPEGYADRLLAQWSSARCDLVWQAQGSLQRIRGFGVAFSQRCLSLGAAPAETRMHDLLYLGIKWEAMPLSHEAQLALVSHGSAVSASSAREGYTRIKSLATLTSGRPKNRGVCIANDFGQLNGRVEGNFAQSCSDLLVKPDTTLEAQCAGGDGSRTGVKLSDIMSNDNGQLYCFGVRGCAFDATGCNDKPS
ncbi:hypothetical protein F4775DRAFT_587737 [Biscogniauxia sp. FL1348]|nr:hypothetical protein F4775DRAFT_587737 [Biscogniauxia sp. FL1348]